MSAIPRRASQQRRTHRWVALAGAVVTAVLAFAFMASPANATDGDTGTVDTNSSSVYTEPGASTTKPGGGDDQCEGDRCKKINWCDGAGKNPGQLTSDAPVVFTDGNKGGEPKCVKRPKIDYKCCVADNNGTANVDVLVTNPNQHKYKVRVWLNDGTPIVKWVDAGSSATFRFKDVVNGDYKIHAAVWAGDDKWCKFGHKAVKVKCAQPSSSPSSPTPSNSQSQSASPAPSISTTPVGNTKPELPVTGAGATTTMLVGLGLVGGGALLLVRRRRNRVRFTA